MILRMMNNIIQRNGEPEVNPLKHQRGLARIQVHLFLTHETPCSWEIGCITIRRFYGENNSDNQDIDLQTYAGVNIEPYNGCIQKVNEMFDIAGVVYFASCVPTCTNSNKETTELWSSNSGNDQHSLQSPGWRKQYGSHFTACLNNYALQLTN